MTTRLAMLTPSSNTVVEPWCARMVAAFEDMSVHFGRVEVLWIDDGEESLAQFQDGPMLDACKLLSHVQPAVIGWNGTAASWLGLDRDRALVDAVQRATGRPAVTSTLSILEALQGLGLSRIGLVTPYVTEIQNRVIANLNGEGLDCVAERHFGISDNFTFGTVPEARIAQAAKEVIAEGAEAVVILCTNLAGAGIANSVEEETGVPVLDSVMLTVWGCLRLAGHGTDRLAPWGFKVARLPNPRG